MDGFERTFIVDLIVPHAQLVDAEEHLLKNETFDGGEDAVYTWTARFPNGYEIDVKVVDGPGEYGGGPWSEVVLFDENGCELGCTEPAGSVSGDWYLFDKNDRYIVYVKSDNPTEWKEWYGENLYLFE
jgi:hypothetical protein